MNWLTAYCADVRRYTAYGESGALRQVLTQQGLWALLQYRLASAVYQSALPAVLKRPLLLLMVVWQKLIEIAAGICLPYTAQIGAGLYIGHFGHIILNSGVVIGSDPRDPRALRLPAYLEQLAGAVDEEHAVIDAELRSLQKNIDHIKVVIGMQQRHARTSGGALETGAVSEILDDALKLAAASDIRSPIHVDRQFRALPEVTIDRHKLLQILMNLLSNARHAVREAPPERQRIAVRLGPAPGDRFSVEVEDRGYGIPPENLARIFSHGFTTKRDGHGFGLHSAANAAREMGGSLVAQSDGPGRGASFRLELPMRPGPPPP